MESILDKINAHKITEIQAEKAVLSYSDLELQVRNYPVRMPAFKNAVTNSDYKSIRIIAEVKKASPSKGIIDPNFDPIKTALAYGEYGADAISVLTDKKFFMGDDQYLKQISEICPQIPLLRKDFILDEYQILKAKLLGASAILLIISSLNAETFQKLYRFAKDLGLDVLTETHDEREVDIALKGGADIIGVNNRNLHTFQTDINISLKLRPLVPESIPFVSESGIDSAEQVKILLEHKISAVLVGEAFMRQGADLIAKMRPGNC
jgi:indole-3-glycerol phosphate synthase